MYGMGGGGGGDGGAEGGIGGDGGDGGGEAGVAENDRSSRCEGEAADGAAKLGRNIVARTREGRCSPPITSSPGRSLGTLGGARTGRNFGASSEAPLASSSRAARSGGDPPSAHHGDFGEDFPDLSGGLFSRFVDGFGAFRMLPDTPRRSGKVQDKSEQKG